MKEPLPWMWRQDHAECVEDWMYSPLIHKSRIVTLEYHYTCGLALRDKLRTKQPNSSQGVLVSLDILVSCQRWAALCKIRLRYKILQQLRKSRIPICDIPISMESTVQFTDAVNSTSQGIGGVVPLRQRSHARRASVDVSKDAELEDAEDEDAGLRDERDYKKRQV
jgi:hypothetical protein